MMISVKTLQYCTDTKRKSCAQYKESPILRDRQLWKKWLQIHQLERPGLWKESPLHQVWQHLGHPALHPIPHHQVHHQVETLCPKNWTETLFLKVLSECLKAFGKIQKNSHLSGRYIWILFKAQHGDFEIIEVKTHSRLNFVISTLIFFLEKKVELNHLAAILHVYTRGLNFMK